MITSESIKAEDIFDIDDITNATFKLKNAIKEVEYSFKCAEKASKLAVREYNKLQELIKKHNNAG